EDERRLLADEGSQLGLQLLVQVEGAVEQPAAGAPRSVFSARLLRLLQDARVMGQAEVVVGAEHDLRMALDLHLGSLRAGDGQEVRIEARRLGIAGDREAPAFLEQVGMCGTVSGLQLGEVGFAPAHMPLGLCVAKAMGQASSESRTPERGAVGSRSKC